MRNSADCFYAYTTCISSNIMRA